MLRVGVRGMEAGVGLIALDAGKMFLSGIQLVVCNEGQSWAGCCG